MLDTISKIKVDWPTAPLCSTTPSIKEWEVNQQRLDKRIRISRHTNKWIDKTTKGWAKLGCTITLDYCRKRSKAIWKSTGSGRLDLLMWRILHLKLPVRDITARWSDGVPWCPWCRCKRETIRHALWECKEIHPIWNQVSHILYECGVSDKLNWKQALIGCKGRMNPALYKTWHTIRAYVLAAIWEARNARVHTSVNRISQFSREKIKGMVIEACKLAESGTSKASKATAILLRKKVVKLKK